MAFKNRLKSYRLKTVYVTLSLLEQDLTLTGFRIFYFDKSAT